MVISPIDTFLGVLAFTALIGGVRGWRREVITSAILLSALLFVNTGGGVMLANLFTQGTGGVTAPSSTTSYTPTGAFRCVDNLPALLADMTFAGMAFFGYRIGRFLVPHANLLASQRFTGMVLGAVNGAVIANFVGANILRGRQLTLGTPGTADASVYLPVVIGVGILSVLVLAFVAGQANKARAAGGGGGGAH